jgi:hypothetical protein
VPILVASAAVIVTFDRTGYTVSVRKTGEEEIIGLSIVKELCIYLYRYFYLLVTTWLIFILTILLSVLRQKMAFYIMEGRKVDSETRR